MPKVVWYHMTAGSKNSPPVPKSSTMNAFLALKHLKFSLYYDLLSDCVKTDDPRLLSGKDAAIEMADHIETQIKGMIVEHPDLQRVEFTSAHLHEAIVKLARERQVHPFLDWVDVQKWDGKPRIERLFTDYFNADDNPYVHALSRLFMIATIRRQRDPGCQFDHFIMLVGHQGLGKSQGIRALVGADFYNDESLFRHKRSKERMEGMAGFVVIEFADMASYGARDIDDVKAFLTRVRDHARMAYDRNPTTRKRACVFIGTTNDEKPLRDLTGNRRFNPIKCYFYTDKENKVIRIDVEKIKRDRAQLWAEAAHYEAMKIETDIMLPEHLLPAAEAQQSNAMQEGEWDVDLEGFEHRDYFEHGVRINDKIFDKHVADGKIEWRIRTRDVWNYVLNIPPSQRRPFDHKKLVAAMKDQGWLQPDNEQKKLRVFTEVCTGFYKIVDEQPEETAEKQAQPKSDDEDTPF